MSGSPSEVHHQGEHAVYAVALGLAQVLTKTRSSSAEQLLEYTLGRSILTIKLQ